MVILILRKLEEILLGYAATTIIKIKSGELELKIPWAVFGTHLPFKKIISSLIIVYIVEHHVFIGSRPSFASFLDNVRTTILIPKEGKERAYMSIKREVREGRDGFRVRAKKLIEGKYKYLDKTFPTKQEAKDYEAKRSMRLILYCTWWI